MKDRAIRRAKTARAKRRHEVRMEFSQARRWNKSDGGLRPNQQPRHRHIAAEMESER